MAHSFPTLVDRILIVYHDNANLEGLVRTAVDAQINFYRIQAISLGIAHRVPPFCHSRGCEWVQCHFTTRNCYSRSVRELTRHNSFRIEFSSPLQQDILSAAKRSRSLTNAAGRQPSSSDRQETLSKHLKPAIEPAGTGHQGNSLFEVRTSIRGHAWIQPEDFGWLII